MGLETGANRPLPKTMLVRNVRQHAVQAFGPSLIDCTEKYFYVKIFMVKILK